MIDVPLCIAGPDRETLQARIRQTLARLDPDAIVRLCPQDDVAEEIWPALRASALRALAPPSMTVSLRWRGAMVPGDGQSGPQSAS